MREDAVKAEWERSREGRVAQDARISCTALLRDSLQLTRVETLNKVINMIIRRLFSNYLQPMYRHDMHP